MKIICDLVQKNYKVQKSIVVELAIYYAPISVYAYPVVTEQRAACSRLTIELKTITFFTNINDRFLSTTDFVPIVNFTICLRALPGQWHLSIRARRCGSRCPQSAVPEWRSTRHAPKSHRRTAFP